MVNLQKLTLCPWEDCASIRIFAPAQKIRGRLELITTAPTFAAIAGVNRAVYVVGSFQDVLQLGSIRLESTR